MAKTLSPLLMSTDSLIMLAPKSGEEIIAEGRILQHCVGGYVRRHARGDTIILFIRHKDKPKIPFFTIEVNPETKMSVTADLKSRMKSRNLKSNTLNFWRI